MWLVALLACAPGADPADSGGPTPAATAPADTDASAGLQIDASFAERFTRGHACVATMAGPTPDMVALLDADATLRMHVYTDPGGTAVASVFAGERLDAVLDDDNCDDLGGGGLAEQSIRMAWSASGFALSAVDEGGGRTVTAGPLTLVPDPEFAPYADFTEEDAADHDAVALESLVLGVVPLGGAVAPLDPL